MWKVYRRDFFGSGCPAERTVGSEVWYNSGHKYSIIVPEISISVFHLLTYNQATVWRIPWPISLLFVCIMCSDSCSPQKRIKKFTRVGSNRNRSKILTVQSQRTCLFSTKNPNQTLALDLRCLFVGWRGGGGMITPLVFFSPTQMTPISLVCWEIPPPYQLHPKPFR